ncbi:c-type cytochrome (plasmid) [Rhizobium sp. TRM96647]|uniref:cytochrome c n=1 Tax=unclassified Rhizobium TaxID=2613769 RepID=UPI0021E80010|nr:MULTISPECIES: cytochrome c [unclassified Rhizobium]MCV3735642.1 c-type cytochrome [Rhizobium sp. TRM96647]MCV3757595.1 c-type cytochrome [Rhizobium sp. TRM96650]
MKLRSLATAALLAGVVGIGAFAWITAPARSASESWQGLGEPDVANGERVFSEGGCASCHAAPGAGEENRLVLAGGAPLKSPFGTFHPPNISSDPEAGIGAWTLQEFGDAMLGGVGRRGEHLYPSFPYASYARMTPRDINDLYGYLRTLPASDNVAPPHDLPFPFNLRPLLGAWKFLYLNDAPRVTLAGADAKIERGQYLVEGPGHCGECHTPRTALGGLETAQWLAGAPNPEGGPGRVPNITAGEGGIGGWSAGDIASYLETGFTPDYDSVGGAMVAVQKNMARLPAADREAIAAYLKAIPAH